MSDDETNNLNTIETNVLEIGQIIDLDKLVVLILGIGLITPISGTIKIDKSDDLE